MLLYDLASMTNDLVSGIKYPGRQKGQCLYCLTTLNFYATKNYASAVSTESNFVFVFCMKCLYCVAHKKPKNSLVFIINTPRQVNKRLFS